jgi:hypothetical protein
MVTCSRQSVDALCGEAIKRTAGTIPGDNIHIKVNMGSDRSWMIPVTSETSWPSFLAFFGEKIAGSRLLLGYNANVGNPLIIAYNYSGSSGYFYQV